MIWIKINILKLEEEEIKLINKFKLTILKMQNDKLQWKKK